MNNLRESVDLFDFSTNRGTYYMEKFVQFLIASIRQRIGTIPHFLDSSELLPRSWRQFRRTSFFAYEFFCVSEALPSAGRRLRKSRHSEEERIPKKQEEREGRIPKSAAKGRGPVTRGSSELRTCQKDPKKQQQMRKGQKDSV